MSSQPRAIVVFGAGPGIGRSVASEFASKGFDHLILLSRNAQRLEQDKAAAIAVASNQNVQIHSATVDLSNQESLQNALDYIDSIGVSIEVVFYNGARVALTPLFETPIEDIEKDFQTTTIGLYTVAKWALPKLQALAKAQPQAKPSLIVTSGFLHKDPVPELFSLSLVKTAQRNLVQSLHKVYNPLGVHVGLVLVGGQVSPEAKVLNPPNIAKVVWDFFDKEATKHTLEVDMEDK